MPLTHTFDKLCAALIGDQVRWRQMAQGATEELVAFGQTRASELAPANYGLLRSSIKTATSFGEAPDGSAVVTGVVYSDLPYALVMEDGRRAGARMPPPGPIKLWVKRQIGMTRARAMFKEWLALARTRRRESVKLRERGRLKKLRASDSPERILTSVAYVIARSIARKGIEGRKFFERTYQEMLGLLQPTIDKHMSKFLDGWK